MKKLLATLVAAMFLFGVVGTSLAAPDKDKDKGKMGKMTGKGKHAGKGKMAGKGKSSGKGKGAGKGKMAGKGKGKGKPDKGKM